MEGWVASSSTRPCADKGRALLDFVRDERELRSVVWDTGLCWPSPACCAAGKGSKDGAKYLYFTPAGSKRTHSESLVSVPAGSRRNKLATRSRK